MSVMINPRVYNLSNKPDERIILNGCAYTCGVVMEHDPATGMVTIRGYSKMVEACDRLYNRLVMNMYMYLSRTQLDQVTAGHKGSMAEVRTTFIKTYAKVVNERMYGTYRAIPEVTYPPVVEAAIKAATEVEIGKAKPE